MGDSCSFWSFHKPKGLSSFVLMTVENRGPDQWKLGRERGRERAGAWRGERESERESEVGKWTTTAAVGIGRRRCGG